MLTAIPEKPVKENPKIVGSAKDTIKKLLAHKNSLKRNEEKKNFIPEPVITPSPKTRLQPFDYVEGIYIGGNYNEEDKEVVHNEDDEEEEEEDEDDDYDNGIGQEKILRGDVFGMFYFLLILCIKKVYVKEQVDIKSFHAIQFVLTSLSNGNVSRCKSRRSVYGSMI